MECNALNHDSIKHALEVDSIHSCQTFWEGNASSCSAISITGKLDEGKFSEFGKSSVIRQIKT